MKLRYVVLLATVAAFAAACADTPTGSKTDRTPTQRLLTEGDSASRDGGTMGSGH
jgi:hypothetical protein